VVDELSGDRVLRSSESSGPTTLTAAKGRTVSEAQELRQVIDDAIKRLDDLIESKRDRGAGESGYAEQALARDPDGVEHRKSGVTEPPTPGRSD
jgi:hypothetical protein